MTLRATLSAFATAALSMALLAAGPTRGMHTVASRQTPEILAMHINGVDFAPGETVTGSVQTTADVTSVEIHVGFWGMPLTHPRRGYFEGAGRIPHLPFFLKGKWTMRVVAKSADGQKIERDIAIRIR